MLRQQAPDPPTHYFVAPGERVLWGMFHEFWELYPSKIGKLPAWKAWRKLRPGLGLFPKIMAGLRSRIVSNPDRWPHPKTFLSQAWWEDEAPAQAAPQESESARCAREVMAEDEPRGERRETILRTFKSRGYPPPRFATDEEKARHGW